MLRTQRRTFVTLGPPMAGSAPRRPIRIAAAAPVEAPARRLGFFVAISLLLHAAGGAAAFAWLSQRAPVARPPIPIAWVRVDAGSAERLVAPSEAAVALPPPRPAPPQRPRPRPAPAAVSAAAEVPAAPAETAPATPESDPLSDDAAMSTREGAAGDPPTEVGAGGGGATDVASRGPGAPGGWMPRGGLQPAPVYPESARRRGTEGVAQVALRLAASGRVDGVRLHQSAGDAQLDGAALAAVRRWRFDAPPPGVDWQDLWFVVPIEFRLQ